MKLINEKGKLFGVINVIDLAIIIVVLALVTGIVMKMGSKDTGKVTTKEFLVTVLCQDVEGNVIGNIKANDRIVYGNVYVNGYVVSAEALPAMETIILQDGTVKEVQIPGLSDILVKIKVLYEGTDNLIMLGKYQVNVGKNFVLKTNRVEIGGVVQDIVEQ